MFPCFLMRSVFITNILFINVIIILSEASHYPATLERVVVQHNIIVILLSQLSYHVLFVCNHIASLTQCTAPSMRLVWAARWT